MVLSVMIYHELGPVFFVTGTVAADSQIFVSASARVNVSECCVLQEKTIVLFQAALISLTVRPAQKYKWAWQRLLYRTSKSDQSVLHGWTFYDQRLCGVVSCDVEALSGCATEKYRLFRECCVAVQCNY